MYFFLGGGGDAICNESSCLAVKADYGVFIKQFYMAANIFTTDSVFGVFFNLRDTSQGCVETNSSV